MVKDATERVVIRGPCTTRAVVVAEVLVPIEITPFAETMKRVRVRSPVEVAIIKSGAVEPIVVEACIESNALGVELPIPTKPLFPTLKRVCVEPLLVVEPMANMTPPPIGTEVLETCMEKFAKGDVVPTPTLPLLLTPLTMNAGVVLPWLAITKAGLSGPISSESLPHGVEDPIPIMPDAELCVDTLKIGTLPVEVAIEKALVVRFATLKAVWPLFVTVKRFILVPLLVVEPIAKSVLLEVVAAWIESWA